MTRIVNSKAAAIMVAGDLVAYILSLIAMVAVRYAVFPGQSLILEHVQSFAVLFVLFVVVNLATGLYGKPAVSSRARYPGLILAAQTANAVVSIAYFYIVPSVITPKTSLAFFLLVSTAAMFVWRMAVLPVLSAARKQPALMIGSGSDMDDLRREIDGNGSYGLVFRRVMDPAAVPEGLPSALKKAVASNGAPIVVADLEDEAVRDVMPQLYSLIFSGVQVIDAGVLYEAVFGRVPLSLLGERWLVENSGSALGSRRVYDALKRAMDIAVAAVLGIVSLVIYPIVWAAVKLDDGGPLLVIQERVGRGGKPIKVAKFRSMNANDAGAYGRDGRSKLIVTRVGRFLRLTRIDELPQLWSVLAGDQSLIGPRPELPSLVKVYEKEIPYYHARHLIKPGLSGWAQIHHRAHPHHAAAVGDTRDKLSYDLYYVKNRSFVLDLRIAVQTLGAIVSRQGV
ncbi:sugar transferase [Patescibacteria group bacterium]|nr:sugar transferase [Patescibacteria group bacterium]